ncbi:MAG: serine/threonine protein kinase [Myxococcales bacterium]|nr:serine/threonine protein kinase [Myxococcales bacterium]
MAAVDAFARRHQLDEDARAALSTLFASYSTLGDGGTPSPIEVAADPVGDRYEDLGLIGRGGQGEVRRVRDHKLGRELAMKILRPMPSPKARARFRLETAITVALQHPGIVPVYDRGITGDGRPWYTMKIVEGRQFVDCILATHRETDPAWTLRRLVDAFCRVCEAVAFAHEQGVVHRDLKPQNVMVGRFGEVVVMDWGLARWMEDAPGVSAAGARGAGAGGR